MTVVVERQEGQRQAPGERNSDFFLSASELVRSLDLSSDGRYLRVVTKDSVQVIDLERNISMAAVNLPAEASRLVVGPHPTRSRFEAYSCAC